ncbi:hypothetical protein Tcan_04771 [Toxocara canis]|uniref:Uncharacterized protein n=1 Tax=Toxocara canis TaxID=6265 RepID=A0A0B2W633_TOXCA|nr:hypothetical protein Tcan_04771 [Toxocara canis]
MDDLWNSLQREAAVISWRSNVDIKLTLGFNHRANRRSSKQPPQSAARNYKRMWLVLDDVHSIHRGCNP